MAQSQFDRTPDLLIIGAGVIGLGLALELKRRQPEQSLLVIDKEPALAAHASGRNSGVLHAGFYYSADSLKARLTRDGNRLMTEYCLHNGLPINRCGKLVVATSEEDLPALDELLRRGRANGVELESVSVEQARRIEPRARTVERALWSPTTSSVDPRLVLARMARDAAESGIQLLTGCAYLGRQGDDVRTSNGLLSPGYVVNAAGLYADRIARDYGFSRHYTILPFKGLYLYCDDPAQALGVHVYPVPDLRQPFLGVHTTQTVDGRSKIGPTAIPAFWRENYHGLENFSWSEMVSILGLEATLFLRNDFGFRQLAWRELKKSSRKQLVGMAGRMIDGLHAPSWNRWGSPGIRAQLVDTRQRTLEMDFRYEGDAQSFHVLNAVSPAFTCTFSFARLLADRLQALRSGAADNRPQ
ncbi:MAG: FAD-dependent oxidoreductase [Candidatus Thiodiazotropha sp.]